MAYLHHTQSRKDFGRVLKPVTKIAHQLPPVHYLDATAQEEASTPLRLLLMFSFANLTSPDIQAMRLLGAGELDLGLMKDLVKVKIFYDTNDTIY